MARTAPVPNIPPIPGMDPGMLVLAGNGDGGGGSGKGANGGGGKDGADGDKDKNDPNGDGKDGKCGGGGPQKCSDHQGAAAGDPVEVASGRVYTQIYVDVGWPGPLPFSFRRKYSSNLHQRDVGLGFGWTHSMAWELLVRGRKIEIWDESGGIERFDVPEAGFRERGGEDSLLNRDGADFLLLMSGILRRFEPDGTGKRYRLKSISDTRNNVIQLAYDAQGRLAEITDSVGRVLRVRSNAQGRIAALEAMTRTMGLVTFAEYRYDDHGDLVSMTNAERHTARFSYVDDHLLASHTQPGALTFHYRYDDQRRCVETWGAFDNGATPALAADAPKLLADGRTRAKGMLHTRIEFYPDGYREVIDSMAVRRFFVGSNGKMARAVAGGKVSERHYDDNGRLSRFVDQLGGVSSWTYDDIGNVVSETDAGGNTTAYVRDAQGREVEVSDSMGPIVSIRYDAWSNPTEIKYSRGDTVFYRYNSQGMPVEVIRPDGARILKEYDAHGNLLSVTQPDGSVWRWSYDELGNQISVADPSGAPELTHYDLLRRPVSRTMADGHIVRFDYSPAGDLIYVGDGKHAVRAEYDGMHLQVRRVFADGTKLEYRYNREAYLAEVVNERGETRKLRNNDEGFLIEATSFNGRQKRFKYDALNRIIAYENGLGGITKYERDAMGQIIAVSYPDGTSETFEYDLRGQLVRAANDAVVLDYERDGAGLMLKETQSSGSDVHYVERTYDALRERLATRTSVGQSSRWERNLTGRVATLALDDAHRVAFDRDVRGFETRRTLPGGGVVASEFDVSGMLTKRALYSPHGQPSVGPGPDEPEWMGARDPAAAILKAFRYDSMDPVARHDRGKGTTSYDLDARGRVVSVVRENTLLESFRHDATNNFVENGKRRVYGPGNNLLEKDDAIYQWNDDGQLIEKRVATANGSEQVTSYVWAANQMLSSVTTPDGTTVEFDYDPFARRVAKRVFRAGGDGELELVSKTRFVWDGPVIAHEIREKARANADPIVEERTYAWADDRGWAPLGHRDSRKDDTGTHTGPWIFYVGDQQETPEHLVTGDGRIVGELERSVYGKTQLVAGDVSTPIRFPGQWEDEETGLFYNRHRYYDPDAGRYISEDAAGSFPDANLFRYTTNPLRNCDLEGLHEADWDWTPKGADAPTKSGSVDSKFDKASMDAMPDASKAKLKTDADGNIDPKSKSAACGSAFAKDRTSDTEAKITRDKIPEVPPNEQGGNLNINGQLPPCPKCQKKMQGWADKNKSTVTYKWPKPNPTNTATFSPSAHP